MYLLLIILPLLSAICLGFFGSKIGHRGSSIISCSTILITFILISFIFYEVNISGATCYLKIFPWLIVDLIDIYWGFLFDTLSVSMMFIIIFISFFVHLYSTEYMKFDPHLTRFLCYLSLFTFFMLILVSSDNFIQLFLGWEGVGICSYLLINFWFGRLQANKAAIKAVIINRVGDMGLLISILMIYYIFNSFDFNLIFACVPYYQNLVIIIFNYKINCIDFIGFFLVIGAVGKSAQIGLHIWLPDAMEGPTPVSALIHAATMVTAGIFLIVRCSPILEYSEYILFLILCIGTLTTFMSASIGLVQNDLKKIIAYSTCSQLGYMFTVCGMSCYNWGIFHLINHAFFKALLFLGAGSVIHALSNEQDIRKMGGLFSLLPFTYAAFIISSFALMGFPFLSGFYSKDIILELFFSNFIILNHFTYWFGVLSAFLTSFYSTRLICLIFLTSFNGFKFSLKNIREPNFPMSISLLILSFCSIFAGFFLKDMFIGMGSHYWGNSIFIHPKHFLVLNAEFLDFQIKLVPIIFSLFGFFSGVLFYSMFTVNLIYLKFLVYNFYKFFNKKWFFDKVIFIYLYQKSLLLTYNFFYKLLDRGFFELIGPQISYFIYFINFYLNKLHSGYIYHYAIIIFHTLLILFLFNGIFNIIYTFFI